jgi:outer membrane protein OmpA-like peptidoglycan-associated protein
MRPASAKRRQGESAGGEGGGDTSVVLFTALGLILLALFIMLNTMANIDENRSGMAIESVHETFGVLPGFRRDDQGMFSAYDRVRRAADLRERLAEAFDGSVEGAVEIAERDGRPVLLVDPDVVYDPGGSAISPRLFRHINALARVLRETGVRARIEGHADASGAEATNWRLSAARAISLYRYLCEAGNVPGEQLSAQGYGAGRPLSNGHPPNHPSHRRIEIIFLVEASE